MASKTFANVSIDQALDVLQSQVAELTRPGIAAFFAVIGEALLPLYVDFSKKNRWGDVQVLREAVTKALEYATRGASLEGTVESILKSIENITPDGEQFDAPDSTFAQDAAICVDAAVRAGNPKEEINPAWVEYALQPAITMLCEEQTGYLDLGSSEKATVWRSQALKHPGLRKAFEALSEMAEFLKGHREEIGSSELEMLRDWASRLLPKSGWPGLNS